jgi:hypothetical protein
VKPQLCAPKDDYGLPEFVPPPAAHRFTCDLCPAVIEYPSEVLTYDDAAFMVSLRLWRHYYDHATGEFLASRCRPCVLTTEVRG